MGVGETITKLKIQTVRHDTGQSRGPDFQFRNRPTTGMKENGLTILTKDKDFLKLSEENRQPPKLIKLDTGNGPTQEVLDAIKGNQQELEAFEGDERSLLRIGQLPERARNKRARK